MGLIAHAQGLKGLGSEYCKHEVQAQAESFGSTRSRLGCEFCKSDCEDGARLGLVSRQEGLLGGSRAREGVGGLPGYAHSIAFGHLGTQVRGQGRGRFGSGPRRERLLGGSRAREGVRGLPAYARISGIGHLVMQVLMIFESYSDCLDL